MLYPIMQKRFQQFQPSVWWCKISSTILSPAFNMAIEHGHQLICRAHQQMVDFPITYVNICQRVYPNYLTMCHCHCPCHSHHSHQKIKEHVHNYDISTTIPKKTGRMTSMDGQPSPIMGYHPHPSPIMATSIINYIQSYRYVRCHPQLLVV